LREDGCCCCCCCCCCDCFNFSCCCDLRLLLDVRLATLRLERLLVPVASRDLLAGESRPDGPDAAVCEFRSSNDAIVFLTAEDLMTVVFHGLREGQRVWIFIPLPEESTR
jgi:hypothetical protein